MSDGQRGKTGKLSTSTGVFRSTANSAAEIYAHQLRTEAMAEYALEVLPVLRELLQRIFGDTPGYGIDDNVEVEGEPERRYGWRIFALGAGEVKFNDFVADAPQRRTLILVELLFDETARPTGYLIDTRRTRTALKTGLFGMRQKMSITVGGTRRTGLNADELADALDEMAETMDR